MSTKEEKAEGTLAIREIQEAFREIVADVRSLASVEDASGLFPHGVTKVLVELKVPAVELKVEISGPETAAGGNAGAVLVSLLTKNAKIAFRANGEGTLSFAGKTYSCLGSPAHAYPTDLTVTGTEGVDKFRTKYSNEFQVDMPFAILIWGQRGIYVHEGADNLNDNGGPSAGCIHLAPGHAKEFYDWVDGSTRIVISYPW